MTNRHAALIDLRANASRLSRGKQSFTFSSHYPGENPCRFSSGLPAGRTATYSRAGRERTGQLISPQIQL